MEFEWDPDKADRNFRRHGVSFDEARTVFGDPLARTVPDDVHSIDEERELTIGVSSAGHTIVVWHTQSRESTRTRIIGARRATSTERRAYESEE